MNCYFDFSVALAASPWMSAIYRQRSVNMRLRDNAYNVLTSSLVTVRNSPGRVTFPCAADAIS